MTEHDTDRAKGSQGKAPEDKVHDYLQALSARSARFDFERCYDARSANGRMQRRVADFLWFKPGCHGAIEVKEVKHDFRLPYQNFEAHQVGKLRIRQLAGGAVLVVVYHSTTRLWRALPVAVFEHREEGKGSWDLTVHRTWQSLPEALDSYCIPEGL